MRVAKTILICAIFLSVSSLYIPDVNAQASPGFGPTHTGAIEYPDTYPPAQDCSNGPGNILIGLPDYYTTNHTYNISYQLNSIIYSGSQNNVEYENKTRYLVQIQTLNGTISEMKETGNYQQIQTWGNNTSQNAFLVSPGQPGPLGLIFGYQTPKFDFQWTSPEFGHSEIRVSVTAYYPNGSHIITPDWWCSSHKSYQGFNDTDGDGMPDVADPFPEDPTETHDSDNDGVGDNSDMFPNDSSETHDDDGDGIGNNADIFPQDANETHDDDGDGTGNNSDVFPQNANETHDDDGDGVGNNSDAFPQDPLETLDSDSDGVGDNADPDPFDPTIRIPADVQINVTDGGLYVLAAALLLFSAIQMINRRSSRKMSENQLGISDESSIWETDIEDSEISE